MRTPDPGRAHRGARAVGEGRRVVRGGAAREHERTVQAQLHARDRERVLDVDTAVPLSVNDPVCRELTLRAAWDVKLLETVPVIPTAPGVPVKIAT